MFSAFAARTGLRAASVAQPSSRWMMQQSTSKFAKRGYATDRTGQRTDDKAKLAFRFGLKDVPVELYPMFVVVVAACGGAIFALGRHLTIDRELRLLPTGLRKKEPSSESSH